jgi:hypothetical protein
VTSSLRSAGVLAAAALLAAASAAHAQYEYDPSNVDEQNAAGRYFGSIKDDKGKPLPDAGVVVQSLNVLIADKTGRFAGHAVDPPVKGEKIVCAKPGYTVVRIIPRYGATNGKPWAEINCVLRKAR